MTLFLIPITMVIVGMIIPVVYPTYIGIGVGVIVTAASAGFFVYTIKRNVKKLGAHYEQTLSSILKASLVCPKCNTKWVSGAKKCSKCGFSTDFKKNLLHR